MNVDRLKRFPSQLIEQRPTECQAETVSDLLANINGAPFDPGFTYAMTLKLQGSQPSTAGADPLAAMLSAVVYGALPTEKEPFDASSMGELFEANWLNYPAQDVPLARNYITRGVVPLYDYQEIVSYLNRCEAGVSLTVKWFSSFNSPNADGTLPPPSGTYTIHNVAVYEAPLKGFRVKPWLGSQYGDGGYAYMSQTIFNQVFIASYGYDTNASRWFSLAKIALNYKGATWDCLAEMLKTS